METSKIKTVSFKEVHAEIEKESQLLKGKYDHHDFGSKGTFLDDIGFGNSIATRMYKDMSDLKDVIERYNTVYPGSKFILKAQLSRVCEKYNLFVRPSEFFLGDIPEKNIKEMMNFRVLVEDLRMQPFADWEESTIQRIVMGVRSVSLSCKELNSFMDFQVDYIKSFLQLQVAAVEELFSPDAFSKSRARILDTQELPPKAQVDTDPIVLLPVKHGYLIVTAWGDEANDELVFNQKLN